MSKDSDHTVFRRASANKWVDKRNNASKGFLFDTEKEAIASGKEKPINAGGGELTVKGRDGLIRSQDTLGGGNDPNLPHDREH